MIERGEVECVVLNTRVADVDKSAGARSVVPGPGCRAREDSAQSQALHHRLVDVSPSNHVAAARSQSRARHDSGDFQSLPVAIVGDVMLDHFIFGRVNRISPEAPVPVVEFDRR